MLKNHDKTENLATILQITDVLKEALEEERDEAISNPRFEGEEELLEIYYKRVLTSIYRVRNNAAALLMRYNCGCQVSNDNTQLIINVNGRMCEFSIPAIKNILQTDFDRALEKNKRSQAPAIKTNLTSLDSNTSELVKNIVQPVHKGEEGISIRPVAIEQEDSKKDSPETRKDEPKQVSDSPLEGKPGSKTPTFNHLDNNPAEPLKEDVDNLLDIKTPASSNIDSEQIKENLSETKLSEESRKNLVDSHKMKIATDESFWPLENNDLDEDFMFEDTSDLLEFDKAPAPLDVNIKLAPNVVSGVQKKNMVIPRANNNPDFTVEEHDIVDLPVTELESQILVDKKEGADPEIVVIPKKSTQSKVKEDMDDLFWNDFTEDTMDGTFKFDGIKPKVPDEVHKPVTLTEPRNSPTMIPEPQKPDVFEDLFIEPPKVESRFKQDILKAEPKEDNLVVKKPDNSKPLLFKTDTVDTDPEDMLEILNQKKKDRQKKQLEEQILEQLNQPISGTVFNLETGQKQSGDLDVESASGKIDKLAEGVINTSKKDLLMDMKTELIHEQNKVNDQLQIQTESDFYRRKEELLLDQYQLTINIFDNEDNIIKTDKAKLLVAPLKIPESGNALVTDIVVFMECNGEAHTKAVPPGGKTTIALNSEDYGIFIRGSWENEEFVSVINVIGVGKRIEYDVKKMTFRPDNLRQCGIGHNVLYIDHITTAHVIPCYFENNLYDEYVDLVAIIIRDYGIDQDCISCYSDSHVEIPINGERYKYNLIGSWEDDVLKLSLPIQK